MIDTNNDLEHAPSAVPLSQEARTIGRRRSGERDRSGARAAEQFAAGAQVRVKLGPRTASWCAGQEGTVISIGRQVEIDLGGRICKINPNELELLVSEELDASLLQHAEDMSLMAPAPSPPAPTPPPAEPNGAVRAAAAANPTVRSPRKRSPSSEERRQQQQCSASSATAAAVHAGASRPLGVSRRERGISSGASVTQGAATDDGVISDAPREAAVPAASSEAVEAETVTDPAVEGSATEDAEWGGGRASRATAVSLSADRGNRRGGRISVSSAASTGAVSAASNGRRSSAPLVGRAPGQESDAPEGTGEAENAADSLV